MMIVKKDLFEELDADLLLEPATLQDKLYTIPMLYNKWQKVYFAKRKELNKKEIELEKLYKKLYYEIKDANRLMDNKKEIDFNIFSDDKYSELNLEVKNLRTLVDVLDRNLKKISQMTFDVKNIIEYQKFLNGL